MKRIVYILLFISPLLSGCSNNNTSGGNEISIRMKSGARNDYKLLSVRDNSLVVFPTDEKYDEHTSITHSRIITYDSIDNIYRKSEKEILPYIAGGVIGGVLGFAIGAALGPASTTVNYDYSNNTEEGIRNDNINPDFITAVIRGSLVGIVIGIIVVSLLPPPRVGFSVTTSEGKVSLRKISAYPHGEPEMLKLVR